jgi:hypothetical protein
VRNSTQARPGYKSLGISLITRATRARIGPFTYEAERGMTQDEFNKTVIRTEDTVSEIWDLRPFEGQQSKAFEYFLQDIDAQFRDGTIATEKRIIVLHDSRLVMSLPTLAWIKQLQALGVLLDFKIEDS